MDGEIIMIELFGQQVEIYQVILIMYVVGWGTVAAVQSTVYRFISIFTGGYTQSTLGKCLDALWYGCIFVLVGTLS